MLTKLLLILLLLLLLSVFFLKIVTKVYFFINPFIIGLF
jgi:hypothetical protein